jgi:hypothetical protein
VRFLTLKNPVGHFDLVSSTATQSKQLRNQQRVGMLVEVLPVKFKSWFDSINKGAFVWSRMNV